MTVPRPAPLAITLLGCAALAFALATTNCKTKTTFTGFVDEDCGDGQDNDADGLKDCEDSDCAVQCAVEVSIFAPPPLVNDTLKISGTHRNAASIAITVSHNGAGGSASISGANWTFPVTGVSNNGTTYTITATASNTKGLKDTASVLFTKGN